MSIKEDLEGNVSMAPCYEKSIHEYIKTINPDLTGYRIYHRDQLPFKNRITGEVLKEMYHVSPNNDLQELTPIVSHRRAEEEDNTIPRIMVAPSLFSCFLSKQNDISEFYEERSKDWKGGWVVYRVPYEWIVIPDKSLVFDAESTAECWIVGFDDQHRVIKPIPVAQCFTSEISYSGDDDKEKHMTPTAVMYLKVFEGEKLQINEGIRYGSGFWRMELRNWGNYADKKWNEYSDFAIHRINWDQWQSRKEQTASMLSYQEPLSLKW